MLQLLSAIEQQYISAASADVSVFSPAVLCKLLKRTAVVAAQAYSRMVKKLWCPIKPIDATSFNKNMLQPLFKKRLIATTRPVCPGIRCNLNILYPYEIDCTIVVVTHSNRRKCRLYVGVRVIDRKNRSCAVDGHASGCLL